MFDYLSAWPADLPSLSDPDLSRLDKAAVLTRLQRFSEAEPIILTALAGNHEPAFSNAWIRLLIYFRLSTNQHGLLSERELCCLDSNNALDRALLSMLWLSKNDLPSLKRVSADWWHEEEHSILLGVAHVSSLLLSNNHSLAEKLIDSFHEPRCMEMVRFMARIYSSRRQFTDASELLVDASARYPQHLGLAAEAAESLIVARSRTKTIPFLRSALLCHGEVSSLLIPTARIKLLKREPAQARRCFLQVQAAASASLIPSQCDPAGLLVTYEQTGHVEWMPYISPWLLDQPVQFSMVHHNLCMHLASINPDIAEKHIRALVQQLMSIPEFAAHATSSPPVHIPSASDLTQPLTIAWLTGDLAPHPVSRFLLGFFRSTSGKFEHHHIVVSLKNHGSESVSALFADVPGIDLLEVGHLAPNEKLSAIRSLQPHVAIDLSGWTDGNFVTAFMARIAPLQINYLGYFGSSGISSVDYWLGDSQLFPEDMREWHQEEIVRLSRPFIAWEPPQPLPEAFTTVTIPPIDDFIRFGSFNHNRKLSTPTLRLWGEIMSNLPESRLVLKANHKGDEATKELLCRRMNKAGIDVSRIIWLPIADSPELHLQQYSQMDVALDCFPNGGCTTTCEALWMGVPVITLTGASYVSRMSTAVLYGAGLSALCASSEEEYLQLAINLAGRLEWLRENRTHWRKSIQSNPIGNAADLMLHLEKTFTKLYRKKLALSAVNLE